MAPIAQGGGYRDGELGDELKLVATKTYAPSTWIDDARTFETPVDFVLPEVAEVTTGNSGNHWITFEFRDEANDDEKVKCRYRGGASQAHPKGAQIPLGLRYHFEWCEDGLPRDAVRRTTSLELHLDNGDSWSPVKGNAITVVELTLGIEAVGGTTGTSDDAGDGGGPGDGGVDAGDESSGGDDAVLDLSDDGASTSDTGSEEGGTTGDGDGDGDDGDPLPPDPSAVAPELEPGAFLTIGDRLAFLYEGPTPIQTGVTPGTISRPLSSHLYGRVLGRDGAPLPGVRVFIHERPEYGETRSRADGRWDLVVNGGVSHHVNFEREGFTRVQRLATVDLQDETSLDDVALFELDPIENLIELSNTSAPYLLAQGSVQTDAEGSRRATLVFEPGTAAFAELPEGTSVPVSTLHLRATEVTVGDYGELALPTPLPPQTAYTYAVDLRTTEADELGAETIRFDRPVGLFVENYRGIPVGTTVPVGKSVDFGEVWSGEHDGRVIAVVDEIEGVAGVDLTGDGIAEDATALVPFGLGEHARRALADLYEPGQELTWVPLEHLCVPDLNYGASSDCGEDGVCENPECSCSSMPPPERKFCPVTGSIIECENRALGEDVPIAGTGGALHYRSRRVPGDADRRVVRVPMPEGPIGDKDPSFVRVVVEVAGRTYVRNGEVGGPDVEIVWDGRDTAGRILSGQHVARLRVGYGWPLVYGLGVAARAESWANFSNATLVSMIPGANSALEDAFPSADSTDAGPFVASRNGLPTHVVEFASPEYVTLEVGDERPRGLGGWTFTPHHRFDPTTGMIHRGDGWDEWAEEPNNEPSPRPGGRDEYTTGSWTSVPTAVAAGPNASFYVALKSGEQTVIRRVGWGLVKSGMPEPTTAPIVAGGGSSSPSTAEGGLAVDAAIGDVMDLAVRPTGELLIAERTRIREVDVSTGTIRTLAGFEPTLPADTAGVTLFATDVDIRPLAVDAAASGEVVFIDDLSREVFRIETDGRLTSVPRTACVDPQELVVGPSGSVFIAGSLGPTEEIIDLDGTSFAWPNSGGLCEVEATGRTRVVAGGGTIRVTDGVPGPQAMLQSITSMAMGPDGTVLFDAPVTGTSLGIRTFRLGSDGRLWLLSGADGGLSRPRSSLSKMAVGPNGALAVLSVNAASTPVYFVSRDLLLADTVSWSIPKIPSLRLASTVGSDGDDWRYRVTSDDGGAIWVFDREGRHLETIDALTGVRVWAFQHDDQGRLVRAIDREGDLVRFNRDGDGRLVEIVGKYGQVTQVAQSSDGWISAMTNPAGEVTSFVYTTSGLLLSMTDPRGKSWIFEWTAQGRLRVDADPRGGSQTLTSTEGGVATVEDPYMPLERKHTTTRTTALGRATRHAVESFGYARRRLVHTDAAGRTSSTLMRGAWETTSIAADGTQQEVKYRPDNRFGAVSPQVGTSRVSLPSGLSISSITSDVLQWADGTPAAPSTNDPFAWNTWTTTAQSNGRTSTTTFFNPDGNGARAITSMSPAGTETEVLLDSLGRLQQASVPLVEPVRVERDVHGRIVAARQGSGLEERSTTFVYGTNGYLDAMTDPLGRTWSFTRDAVGRVLTATAPDGRVSTASYDAAGNLIAFSPPGRPAYVWQLDAVGDVISEIPPYIGVDTTTSQVWSLDGELETVLRPDGKVVDPEYDAAGELVAVRSLDGDVTMDWSDETGQLLEITGPSSGGSSGQRLAYQWDGPLLLGELMLGEVIGWVEFTYDDNFWVDVVRVNGESVSYDYDLDGRITRAGVAWIARTFGNGRASDVTIGGTAQSLAYDPFGALASMRVDAGSYDGYEDPTTPPSGGAGGYLGSVQIPDAPLPIPTRQRVFGCFSGELIAWSALCDGTTDCDDGSDELGDVCDGFECEAVDGAGVVTVPLASICDGTAQCAFGEDELGCMEQAFCADGGGAISDFDRCDGTPNCADGSDESLCLGVVDARDGDGFECRKPVSPAKLCDGVYDCPSGSLGEITVSADEPELCAVLAGGTYTCGPAFPVCDEIGNCEDPPVGPETVAVSALCDGVTDCAGGDDEAAALCPFVGRCPGGGDDLDACLDTVPLPSCAQPIDPVEVCDGTYDCAAGVDELAVQCGPSGQWYCGTADDGSPSTAPLSGLCDGTADCSNGSDESQCGTVRCADGGYVVPTMVCDGAADCADGSDEVLCADEHGACRGDGSCLYLESMERDKLGRITTKVETVLSTTTRTAYTYDVAGRLVREERSSISNVTGYAMPDVTTWVYDDNGNVLSESRVGPSAGGVTTGTVDAQERLLSWGGTSYEYGAAGERLRRVEGASEEAYSWDVYGNLLAVSLADGREVTYVVDGRGRRVGRKVDGVLERGWLYQDDLEPVAEVDAAGNVTARFVYGSRGHVPDYMVKDGRTWKFITDHLGSVVLVADAYGTEVGQRRVYDAYGKVLYDSNPGFQPFGYAGGLEDEDTRWVRFGARDYDPATRRWTTKDPIGLSGGVNVYGYVGGDPVNLVDVTGLIRIDASFREKYPVVSAAIDEHLHRRMLLDLLTQDIVKGLYGVEGLERLRRAVMPGDGPWLILMLPPHHPQDPKGRCSREFRLIEIKEDYVRRVERGDVGAFEHVIRILEHEIIHDISRGDSGYILGEEEGAYFENKRYGFVI